MKTFPEFSGGVTVYNSANNDLQTIHLAMAFDEAYVSPFTVLLTSIFHNNKNNRLHFHVITSGVSEHTKNDLAAYCEKSDSLISFYTITPELLNGLVLHPENHLSIACYYRLFFAELVPEYVSKLLYLDTDMLVLGNLRAVYDLDMGEYAVGAVAELDNPVIRTDLGFTEPDIYFNSGVLMINILQWKKQDITKRSVEFTIANPEKVIWADQDALNGILLGNYYRLPSKYNILHLNVPRGLSRQGYEQFISDKTIIHYTNSKYKPWSKTSKSKLRFLYVSYLSKSPRWKERITLDLQFYSVKLKKKAMLGLFRPGRAAIY